MSLGSDKSQLLTYLGAMSSMQQALPLLLMSRVNPPLWASALQSAAVRPFVELSKETSQQ